MGLFCLWLLGLVLPFSFAQAQILDDTTVQKYGAKTTRYRLLQDVFDHRDTLYRIDTVLQNFHNHDDYIFRDQWPNQDLGNLGTAQKPIFPVANQPIGIQFGYNTYDQFGYLPELTRFYNTFSPHTWVDYIQGPNERSNFNMGVTRNLGANTNFGFEYQRINSNKMFGAVRAEDPAVSHHSYRATFSHLDPKGRFQVYGSFINVWHKVFETGGVLPTKRDSTNEADPLNRKLDPDSMLYLEIQRPQLIDGTFSLGAKQNWRLYTQYCFGPKKNYQFYYQFERDKRSQSFEAVTVGSAPYFRDTTVWANQYGVDSAGNPVLLSKFNYNDGYTNEEFNYLSTTNQFGIKGNFDKFTIGGYSKLRNIGYDGNRLAYTGLSQELYIGGHLHWRRATTQTVRIEGQHILGRDFALDAAVVYDRLKLIGALKRTAPTLYQTQYYGNHFSWNNLFDYTSSVRLTAEYLLPVKRIQVLAGLDFQSWDKLIVNGPAATPVQLAGATSLTSGYVQLNYLIWKIRNEQQIRYSANSGEDAIRVPAIWVHWKSYFEYKPRKNPFLEVNIGFDLRYRSSYKADYYMAVTQQFYLQPNPSADVAASKQNVFPLAATFVMDPYFSLRIHKALVLIKVNNALQGIGGQGYFTTPFYPGLQRSFQFGIKWYFFD